MAPPPRAAAPPSEVPAHTAPSADDVELMRRKLLAEELWARANAAFLSNDFTTSLAILESVPGMESVQPKVGELRQSIQDVTALLKKGRAQANAGNCDAAIKTYNGLLTRYPHVREAKRARSECQSMLIPTVAE